LAALPPCFLPVAGVDAQHMRVIQQHTSWVGRPLSNQTKPAPYMQISVQFGAQVTGLSVRAQQEHCKQVCQDNIFCEGFNLPNGHLKAAGCKVRSPPPQSPADKAITGACKVRGYSFWKNSLRSMGSCMAGATRASRRQFAGTYHQFAGTYHQAIASCYPPQLVVLKMSTLSRFLYSMSTLSRFIYSMSVRHDVPHQHKSYST
jgi:hypothetical protein